MVDVEKCRRLRDDVLTTIDRRSGGPIDAELELAAEAGCIEADEAAVFVNRYQEWLVGESPVTEAQALKRDIRAAFADSTQDFGDLQAQRAARRANGGEPPDFEQRGLEGEAVAEETVERAREDPDQVGIDELERAGREQRERPEEEPTTFEEFEEGGGGDEDGGEGERRLVRVQGTRNRQTVSVEGDVPARVLEGFPSERQSDDPLAQFLSELASAVAQKIGPELDDIDPDSVVGEVVFPGGTAWRFVPRGRFEDAEDE